MYPNKHQEQLPLYHFFERLRQNNFPLGVSEYETFLFALRERMGLSIAAYRTLLNAASNQRISESKRKVFPQAELLQLCKLLWLKPNQSTKLFEDLYEESLSLEKQLTGANEEKGENIDRETDEDRPTNQGNSSAPEPQDKIGKRTANTPNKTLTVRIGISKVQANSELWLQNNKETEKTKFLFIRNYFPIDKRKVNQSLRLISAVRESINSSKIDIGATVQKTVEKGILQEVVFEKYSENAVDFLLLIDHHGSMIAFRPLTDMIKSVLEKILAVRQSSFNSKFHIFYFYNSPGEHLYTNMGHTQFESKEKVLSSLGKKSAYVIIVSDGGAARGSYSKKRVETLQAFLSTVYEHTNKIVWLNPMPKKRWEGTSAEEISENVAMFEADEMGIKNAVDLLKGAATAKLNRYVKSN